MPTDSSTRHEIASTGKAWEMDKYKCLFRPHPSDPNWLTCLPTGKQVHVHGGGHDKSEAYVSHMKKFLLAIDMYAPFDMEMVPTAPGTIPTLNQLREGYGSVLPAYDMVTEHLPAGVRVTSGKKGTIMAEWPTCAVLALGAVYWNGRGGPNFLRQKMTQGGRVANWTLSDEPCMHSVAATTVYEDPSFESTTTKCKSFQESERLIDPSEAPKVLSNSCSVIAAL